MKLQRVIEIMMVLCCLVGSPGEVLAEKDKLYKRFTPEEDKALIAAVQKYRPMNWERVAEWLPGRTARQCRDRWTKFLDPNVLHRPFSSEEDELLMQLVAEYGRKWTFFLEFFPSRTSVQLKNRYNLKNRKKERKLRTFQMLSACLETAQLNELPNEPPISVDFDQTQPNSLARESFEDDNSSGDIFQKLFN
ncbi:MAG: hypothetical protein LBG98_03975 [Puniceicoccales bacterium]|jgi:hypothetical protein|nr:hypothetical protein [Puniceicoccales bacterium]